MIATNELSRRRALRAGGGAILALVIGGVAGWADRRGGDEASGPPVASPTGTTTSTTTRPITIPDFGEVDPGIVAIGRRVVELTGEDDLAALLATLPDAGGDPIAAAAATTRAEFAAGDTISVDGWVLARSEARAAAVLALSCDAAEC